MEKTKQVAPSAVPRHVAIIMDGNNRWAKKRFMPGVAGHKAGVDAVRAVIEVCAEAKVEVLTLFAFSSENWQRPADEVSALMDLFFKALRREAKRLNDNNISLRIIGDRSRFHPELQAAMREAEAMTAGANRFVLQIAANYGGQWDIAQAAQRLAREVQAGHLRPEDITPELLQTCLATGDLPLPDLIGTDAGQPVAMAMAGHLLWMERASNGAFKICRTAAELRDCLARGVISGIMHMEGAEPIGADLDALYTFHAMGLRSIGPVWSRPTVFGHGVPFRFPGHPDTGEGLTDAGKRLIRACNELKIMIDLSHINEAGFNDVARLSDAPLVATHSNAHVVCETTRNLTDRQLAVIRDSNGMVGLNFATCFLREDGRESPDMTWEPTLRHLDHLIAHLGEDHVGMGSDFDGATVPNGIRDVTGLPALQQAMRAHGYDAPLMKKLCTENWFRVLERTWAA